MKRTDPQNNAMHKYFELLADALNDAGLEKRAFLNSRLRRELEDLSQRWIAKGWQAQAVELMDVVMADESRPDIPWCKETVKEDLWRQIQKGMGLGKSTTELEKMRVSDVYDVLDRHLSSKYGVHVPFPSEEEDASR